MNNELTRRCRYEYTNGKHSNYQRNGKVLFDNTKDAQVVKFKILMESEGYYLHSEPK